MVLLLITDSKCLSGFCIRSVSAIARTAKLDRRCKMFHATKRPIVQAWPSGFAKCEAFGPTKWAANSMYSLLAYEAAEKLLFSAASVSRAIIFR
jgi:hypothetical protein